MIKQAKVIHKCKVRQIYETHLKDFVGLKRKTNTFMKLQKIINYDIKVAKQMRNRKTPNTTKSTKQ